MKKKLGLFFQQAREEGLTTSKTCWAFCCCCPLSTIRPRCCPIVINHIILIILIIHTSVKNLVHVHTAWDHHEPVKWQYTVSKQALSHRQAWQAALLWIPKSYPTFTFLTFLDRRFIKRNLDGRLRPNLNSNWHEPGELNQAWQKLVWLRTKVHGAKGPALCTIREVIASFIYLCMYRRKWVGRCDMYRCHEIVCH